MLAKTELQKVPKKKNGSSCLLKIYCRNRPEFKGLGEKQYLQKISFN